MRRSVIAREALLEIDTLAAQHWFGGRLYYCEKNPLLKHLPIAFPDVCARFLLVFVTRNAQTKAVPV